MYTSFKDFSLNVYDDTNLLHLVLDSQRLSFSQELTPTLTLGLGLGLGIAKNVLVYMALIAFKSFIEFVFIFFYIWGLYCFVVNYYICGFNNFV